MPDRYAFDPALVASAVRQRPLEELRAVVGRRRRRRTVGLAVVAVVLVTLGVILPLAPRHAAPVVSPAPLAGVSRVVVFSWSTVVAVRSGPCSVTLALTTDAGRTWTAYAGPQPPYRCDPARSTSAVLVLEPRIWLVTVGGAEQVTRDAGLTWQPVPGGSAQGTGSGGGVVDVTAFSPAARVADCGSGLCYDRPTAPYAYNPDSGLVETLRRTRGSCVIDGYQRVDGTLWATLTGPGPKCPAVGWSTDGGDTWQTHLLPANASVQAVVVLDRHRAYVYYAPSPGGAGRLLATADGGATWQDTPTGLPITAHPRAYTVTADGTLLISDSDPRWFWFSHDNGATFTRVIRPEVQPGRLAGATAGPGIAAIWTSDPGAGVVWLTTGGDQSLSGVLLPR